MDITTGIIITCSIITGISGGVVVIWKLLRPHILTSIQEGLQCRQHDAELEKINESLAELNDKKVNDYHAINKLSGEMRMALKAMHALLTHAETGNDTGKMAEVRGDLVNFIIDNKGGTQ